MVALVFLGGVVHLTQWNPLDSDQISARMRWREGG
jgi:hypothetical protein